MKLDLPYHYHIVSMLVYFRPMKPFTILDGHCNTDYTSLKGDNFNAFLRWYDGYIIKAVEGNHDCIMGYWTNQNHQFMNQITGNQ